MASKRLCTILMFIVLNVGLSFAQQTQTIDVISLKSGGKINGKIIEKKEGESVTILILPANATMKIRWEDIKDISRTTIFSFQSHTIDSSRSATSAPKASDSVLTSYWLDAGIGNGSRGSACGASASFLSGYTLFTVRYDYNFEFDILGFGPTPHETDWDIGFLCGMVAKSQNFYSSVSVGLGVAGGVRRGALLERHGLFGGRYEAVDFLLAGIPVEGQLFWTPGQSIGIGFTGFADLNHERSFGGVLFCLRVGKLW